MYCFWFKSCFGSEVNVLFFKYFAKFSTNW